jgi:hypothetical protein
MYGKSYESMYKGSMVGAGLNVFAVWNYIITNTHFGVIELNPKLLHAILGGKLEDVESALKFLSQPDGESRNKEAEGRRIVKEGQFQYRVVSWSAYQEMRNEGDLREYNRQKQAEHRAKLAAMTVEERAAWDTGRVKGRRRVKKTIGVRAAENQGEIVGRQEGVSDALSEAQRLAEIAALGQKLRGEAS